MTPTTLAKATGVLGGTVLAVVALAAWRVPAHDVGPGATVTVTERASGGVGLVGAATTVAELRATGPRDGVVEALGVTSAAHRRVTVGLDASAPDLDALLQVALTLDGRTVFRPGEVVTFRSPDPSQRLITHRVRRIRAHGSRLDAWGSSGCTCRSSGTRSSTCRGAASASS